MLIVAFQRSGCVFTKALKLSEYRCNRESLTALSTGTRRNLGSKLRSGSSFLKVKRHMKSVGVLLMGVFSTDTALR